MRQRLLRDALWFLGMPLGIYTAFTLVQANGLGLDAHAYWQAARGEYYVNPPATRDAYLYSPAFAQIIWPFALLPWTAFNSIWMLAAGSTFAYLLKPLGWQKSIPLWALCLPEIVAGNVFWVFALVVAFGLRRPGLWAFVFLTKISPAIGPIWFAARREWKKVGISAAVTILVVGISYLIDPESWRAWIEFLRTHVGSTNKQVGALSLPPMVRIPAAVALIIWGALRTKRWTIPAAMVLATPVFGIAALTVFAGLPRLMEFESKRAGVMD